MSMFAPKMFALNWKIDLFQDEILFNRFSDNFGNLVYHKFSPAWVEECLVFESLCILAY